MTALLAKMKILYNSDVYSTARLDYDLAVDGVTIGTGDPRRLSSNQGK